MSGVMQRTLAILERLAADVDGLPLSTPCPLYTFDAADE